MQLCVKCAGFTPGEADRLRRAMAAWKRHGDVTPFRDRIIRGMTERGYGKAFAERIFKQIEGFGDYGFPESHAASFALLAYDSAWIKRHEPAIFLCALLNAQPMGFYSPSQLVQDARRHGVEVRPVDVQHSAVEATLEGLETTPAEAQPPVRLGLAMVAGLGTPAARRIAEARADGPFADVQDLARRARLEAQDLRQLASADALMSLAGHRRQQVWEAAAWLPAPALLAQAPIAEPMLQLPLAGEGEEIVFDYAAVGLTLRRHPLALIRPQLARRHLLSAAELEALPSGRRAAACGIVTGRQQPQTAKGTIFVSLEDESGLVNVIVWRDVQDRYRHALLHARLLAVRGQWQNEAGVRHLVARHLEDLTPLLGRLGQEGRLPSRDFH